jgi:hypothetical protein
MSEQENEIIMLLKELVDKVKTLEEIVYNQDNVLMKSGFVVTNTPKPAISNNIIPTGDLISKMDWSEIHKIVEGIEG